MRSEAIVSVRVEQISSGPSLRHDPESAGRDTEPIPTERVAVAIRSRLRGNPPDPTVVFRTKFEALHGAEGDPPYAAGQDYVLFLRQRQSNDGTVLPVAPDGRVALVDGRLQPLIEGPVADEIRGKSVAELERLLP
ncbi:MAG: hypothetical protein M3340_01130 [Actinomycetota bacterium]|nr:hypothetical protein [Actinomycetota bacterium]